MKPRSRLQIYYGLYLTGILASVVLAAVLSPFLHRCRVRSSVVVAETAKDSPAPYHTKPPGQPP
jgi:hypothetical protein